MDLIQKTAHYFSFDFILTFFFGVLSHTNELECIAASSICKFLIESEQKQDQSRAGLHSQDLFLLRFVIFDGFELKFDP